MKDLRLYANDLIGKRLKPKQDKREQWEGRNPDRYKYVITEVYQNYVRCTVTCENGYTYKESFTVGQLVELGIIECEGQIGDHEKNEKGVKEGYGHSGKGKPIKGRGQDTL